MEGFILLYRKIIDNPYYFSEPFTRSQAWIDMLLIANHKSGIFYKRGIKVEVGRGQIGYDSQTLAERWRWSRGKVLRFLTELQKDQQIVQQKTNVTTLISIVNYNTYQTNGTAKSTADDTASSTANGTQIVQQTDTNNNDNNNNNVNNDKKALDVTAKIKILPTPQKSILDRKNDFKLKVIEILNTVRNKYFNNKDENRKFFDYWSEHGENDKKMRWEKEKSFDIALRMDRWYENVEKQSNKINGQPTESKEARTVREFEEITMAKVAQLRREEELLKINNTWKQDF